MFLFPMTESTYWLIGLIVIATSGAIGLLINHYKKNNFVDGLISGLEWGFLLWNIGYLFIYPILK